jgi:hypothetical protein
VGTGQYKPTSTTGTSNTYYVWFGRGRDQPPGDDYLVNAFTVSAGSTVAGSNVNATMEVGEALHAGVGSASVWWRFTATKSGFVKIDTVGSSFDTVLGVYTGNAVNALTLVAADDDCPGLGTISCVGFYAKAGTTYRIALAGFSGSTGSYQLHVSVIRTPHDFNGDGIGDILIENTGGGIASWLLNSSAGVASALAVGATTPGVWTIVGLRDLNGDGQADILFRATDGSIADWLLNAGTYQSQNSLGNPTTSWDVIGTGDFNGDGIGDVVFRGGGTAVGIWYMNSSGQIGSIVGVGSLPNNWVVAGTGDFNGDGVWDILWTSGGAVGEWLMNANGTIKSVVGVGSLAAGWSLAGTGDVNGDGITDILVSAPVSGSTTVAVWFIGSNGLVSSIQGTGTMASGWTVAQTGDGKADILWYNGTSGGIVTWLLNSNGTVSSQVAIGSLPPSSWMIVNANSD